MNKLKSKWIYKSTAIYALVLTALAFKRNSGFYSWWDLGLIIDVLNNSIKGMLFYSNEFRMYTTTHLNPLMTLLFPFHYIFQSTYIILLLYCIVIASTAFFIYKTAKLYLDENKSRILTIGFMIIPTVWRTALEDFQPIALGLPVLAYLMYKTLKEEFDYKFYIGIMLFLFAQENAALVLIFIGIYMLIKRHWSNGVKTILIGIIWFILAVNIILPALNGGVYANSGYVFLQMRYGYLGNSIGEIIRTIVTQPIYALTYTSLTTKMFYLTQWLFTFAFLPLATLIAIPAIPVLASNFFSTDLVNQCFAMHQSVMLAVIMMISTIYVCRKKPVLTYFVLGAIIISTVFNAYPLFRQPIDKDFPCYKDDFRFVDNKPQTPQMYPEIREQLKKIPKNASVVATQQTYSFFAGYKEVRTSRFIDCYREDYVLIDFLDGENPDMFPDQLISELSKGYDMVYRKQQFFIFKNKGTGEVCV